MDLLQTIVAAIVTLGILVTIHEYGHFWVARRCGVRVLRFSIGFGKGLFRWYDRQGTEYVIASIPLGGYVKMLDEREGDVPADQLEQAFNRKPLPQRVAIVAAGPIVNLVFAVFAYWLMFMSGIHTVAPVIGTVQAPSPAADARLNPGEEIVTVDGYATRTWEEVSLRLAARIGDTGELLLRTRPLDGGLAEEHRLPLQRWQIDEEKGPLLSLGVTPYRPEIPAVIGRLVEDGAAAQAGLQVGDRVLAVDGEPLSSWMDLVARVQASPAESLLLEIERGSAGVIELAVTPARQRDESGAEYGYIGAGVEPVSWPDSMRRSIQYGPLDALVAATAKSYQMITLTLESIGKMIQGLISVKNLSGPITIAKVAGASAESGLETFLNFLAYLSISLGVLNLLPIPMLDGGHLLYYLVEAVRGRPVSERTQVMGLKLGMALLLTLMMLALYNDLARL
ncbi:sigma E protease regulator RseP [Motiliproteus sediminis]|uniref:sigma E protease regulator RseP n=1 Tax=Motiliproteus sediminis TaxID=1468178 RepID=UPI001AEFF56F|nr:sigma E protease regulator RseP [Motiliproteus sediminis]